MQMLDLKKPFTFDRVVRIGISLAIIWGLILLTRYLSGVLIPFAIAIILAYLLNPMVIFIQKFVRKKIPSVIISVLLTIGIVFLAFRIIFPIIYKEIFHMGNILYSLLNNPQTTQELSNKLPGNLWETIVNFMKKDEIRSFFSTGDIFNLINKFSGKILPGVLNVLSGTATVIISILGSSIILLYLVFLLIDYDKFEMKWKELIPGIYRQTVVEFVEDFTAAMNNYFRNQALIALISGTLYIIAFSIIGMPLAIVLGILIGIFIMVPYLHAIILIPAFFLGFLHSVETGSNPLVYLSIVALIFIVIQTIQDYVLTPRILGKATGMNPAIIILSITIWGKLLGFFGLLIALPLTYLFLIYYKKILVNVDKQLGSIIESDMEIPDHDLKKNEE